MNEYKVRYSYQQNGRRVYEEDTSLAWTSSEAVHAVEEEYADFQNLRIETVWKDCGNSWAVDGTWKL